MPLIGNFQGPLLYLIKNHFDLNIALQESGRGMKNLSKNVCSISLGERVTLMSSVSVMRDLLLEELKTGLRTTGNLLDKVEPDQWSHQPQENMMSLLELARHLAQIPLIDLAILQEKEEAEVKNLEEETAYETAKELTALMERGFMELKGYMEALSDEDFLHKETRPFYADRALTQAKWLTEIVTHVFHHRAQLFNYLKQLGHPVNMFDLY